MTQNKYELAHKQAATWHVRLQSSPVNIDDQRLYKEWLAESPLNKAAYDEMQAVSENIDDLVHELDLDPTLASPQFMQLLESSKIHKPTPRLHWQAMAAGFSLIGALLLMLAVYVGGDYNYQTGSAEQRLVHLPDGSKITINAKTGIDVEFDEVQRHIVMGPGEAFFEVEKDPARPFVVTIDGHTVRAVGTAFNIRNRGSDVSVTVTEGKVSFTGKQQPSSLLMSVKQGVEVRNEGVPRLLSYSESEFRSISAWQKGKLIFIEKKLTDIVSEVNNYTPGKIMILDKELEGIIGGGVFDTGDADALLNALEMSLPVKSIRITPYLTLLTSK